jgi:uncharacterized membrane protein YgdD (TMEM256/DUF423 family)
MTKRYLIISIIFILTSIILGAFGAHGLKSLTTDLKILNAFEVGVRYLTYSGLGMLILTLNSDKFKFSLNWIYRLISSGCLIFSGCLILYTMSITLPSLKPAAMVVPLGGLLMIIGWAILLFKSLNKGLNKLK